MCRNIRYIILLFLLPFALLFACQRHDTDLVETRRATSRIEQVPELVAAERSRSIEGPSPELSAIDSLMWRQPDSALVCLLPYFDTCCKDVSRNVSTTYNRHYANLLLSELLYKNDYAQTNRPALLQAVTYFDSLVRQAPPFKGGGGIKKDHSQNDNLAFLDSRAHYIKGVGYYENDSIVPACAEYLKALEVMESHFEEKDLVGEKARFMTYIYNRLTELFSDQFMMEPAIACGEKALLFCMVEPVSSLGASRILYQIGKQYDEMKELDKARQYYNRALESMANTDNLVYRDIVTSKALCEYDAGAGMEQSLEKLRRVIILADTEDERLNRFLTMGGIFYEARVYDSAIKYLEPAFNGSNSIASQIQVADYLRIIYDSIGNEARADEYIRFLAGHKKLEGEHKALVSKLEELFASYLNQKQEKEAEKARKKDVKKAVGIIIPFVTMIVLATLILAKLRGKKMQMLKEQQKEAKEAFEEAEKQHELTLQRQQTEAETLLEEKERQLEKELRQRQTEAERMLEDKEKQHQQEMESERQTHKLQQAALSGRLKRSNEELRDVSKQLEQSLSRSVLSEPNTSNDYTAFINAPICLYIIELVHKQQFKSKMDYLIYKDNALSKEQVLNLRNAAEEHLARFILYMHKQFPKLNDNDMDYCYLFLLGLNEADISALMQRAYTTVCDRSRKIIRIIGTNDSLYRTLFNMLDE